MFFVHSLMFIIAFQMQRYEKVRERQKENSFFFCFSNQERRATRGF